MPCSLINLRVGSLKCSRIWHIVISLWPIYSTRLLSLVARKKKASSQRATGCFSFFFDLVICLIRLTMLKNESYEMELCQYTCIFDTRVPCFLQVLNSFYEGVCKVVTFNIQSALSFRASPPWVSAERYRYGGLPMVARLVYSLTLSPTGGLNNGCLTYPHWALSYESVFTIPSPGTVVLWGS